MNIFERYDNLFMRELVRIKFKIHSRENDVKNFISLSNDDNDYLFCDTFSLLFIIRNRRRIIDWIKSR